MKVHGIRDISKWNYLRENNSRFEPCRMFPTEENKQSCSMTNSENEFDEIVLCTLSS